MTGFVRSGVSRLGACAALALLISIGSGCAAMRAGAARQRYINDQTQAFVYRVPIAQVWPEVRKLLFEQGFQAKESDTGNAFSIETEPKAGENNSSVRYLVQGTKVDEGSCRVEFTKMTASGNSAPDSGRDLELEWLLIKRTDPAAAQQIETAAQAEGEKAKSQS